MKPRLLGHSGLAALAALIVVMLAMLAACDGGDQPKDSPPTEASPGAETPSRDQPEASEVEVSALAFTTTPEGFGGEVIPVKVTVKPSEAEELRVGFFEEEVGGSGPMWEAAGWTAVSVASLLLGIDPTLYEFSFSVGGEIDGPSAGALMTVGVVAAILGDEVSTDAAMTGTISPDGTIGPVGGIPHKVAGAADDDKTIVLVPGGQRYDLNLETEELDDVVDVGERLGVEVKQVSTIYEAYEEITGSPLPRPEGTAAADFPSSAYEKLRAKATEWFGRYEQAHSRFDSLPEEFTVGFDFDLEMFQADDLAMSADSALQEGLAAVAYERALSAAAYAEATLETANLTKVYIEQGMDPMIDQLLALAAVDMRLQASLDRLEAEAPRSATDVLALVDAYSNVAVAQDAVLEGDSILDLLAEGDFTEEEVLGFIFLAAFEYIEADFFLDAAQNNLDYGLGFGTAPVPDQATLEAVAEIMRRAADANLAFFETVIIEDVAQSSGMHPDEVKAEFLIIDLNYDTAVGATGSAAFFEQELTTEPERSIAILGSALTAWAQSNLLLAKYYSLGAEYDFDLGVTGFSRERALTDTLDLASDRAEELLRLVGDEEPVPALYYHENAKSYREGDAEDKISALFYDWQAAALAEMLAYFNGDFDQAISQEPAGESPLWRWGATGISD